MLFDDRLATVLRSGAAGEAAARTQYRQLLDLLGSAPATVDGPLMLAAYRRLGEIGQQLPPAEQARIVREPWLRLRSPRLLEHLAGADSQTAAAAMAMARLDEAQWEALIPRLPVTARGFLRHRRDLPAGATRLLARLGVRDLVLPQPPGAPGADGGEARQPAESGPREEISALVRRIEAFQEARRAGPAEFAPRLPLDDGASVPANGAAPACDFASDAAGVITWADNDFAPALVGRKVNAPGTLDPSSRRAMALRQPVRGGELTLVGIAAVGGAWHIDAAPTFAPDSGAFLGYAGRLRRPPAVANVREGGPADRMRQVLHELRTPVGAIQGFAEIIQQQLFGPAPNTYRALAAAVGVDAARLLAGFDEIDRMVRLEGAATELSADGSNLRLIVERTLKRLESVMRPRSARIRLLTSGDDFAVRLGEGDAAQLVWRVLATVTGALGPGELVEAAVRASGGMVELGLELPVSMAGNGDVFATSAPSQALAVTAGMFGTGFTLRLARAEAEAAGGSLVVNAEALVLALPALTGAGTGHSDGDAERGPGVYRPAG